MHRMNVRAPRVYARRGYMRMCECKFGLTALASRNRRAVLENLTFGAHRFAAIPNLIPTFEVHTKSIDLFRKTRP